MPSDTLDKHLTEENARLRKELFLYATTQAELKFPSQYQDPRFSSLQDKGKACFHRYNEWAVCMRDNADADHTTARQMNTPQIAVKSGQAAVAAGHPCAVQFLRMNQSCPSYWRSRWQDLRENNRWFGQGGAYIGVPEQDE